MQLFSYKLAFNMKKNNHCFFPLLCNSLQRVSPLRMTSSFATAAVVLHHQRLVKNVERNSHLERRKWAIRIRPTMNAALFARNARSQLGTSNLSREMTNATAATALTQDMPRFVSCVGDSLKPCVDSRRNREQKCVSETNKTPLFCVDIVNRL